MPPPAGGQRAQQLYNIINSLVVTYYIGGDAFAALGVAESVMNLFIYVITGACMGSSVLVARFFGEENFPRLRQQLFVSGVLIGGTVLAAVTLTLLLLDPLLVLIQTPPELMGYVTDYLRIILVGMVFTFAYNYLAATLRAIGNTQAALFFLLISLGYNLGAAWVLVAQLDWASRGPPWPPPAPSSSPPCCAWCISGKTALPDDPALRHAHGPHADAPHRQLWGGGRPPAVQPLSGQAYRPERRQRHQHRRHLRLHGHHPRGELQPGLRHQRLRGHRHLCGPEPGGKKHRRALDGFRNGAAMVVGIGVVFSLLLAFGGHALVTPFLDGDGESIALGASYLLWMGPFYFLSFIGHSYVGHYRGIGRMNVTFIGTTLQIAVRVIGTYALVGLLGLNAVALATGLGWVVIVLFHSTVFVLELKGIGYRLPTRDEA